MTFRSIAFLLFTAVSLNALAANEPPASILSPQLSDDAQLSFDAMVSRGYTSLFNGADLSGWRNPYSHGEASVVDGEIHLRADKKFFLVTEKQYSDFRLSVDIHLPEGKANSGVMFRCHVDEDAKKVVYGYQAECDGSDRRWSGGFYDESRRGWIWPSTKGRSTDQFLKHEDESKAFFATRRVRNALRRNGWNRYVITCVKDLISIEVNGIRTVRFRDATDAKGFIGIQHHGEHGQIYRFRNLFIKELPSLPAADHVSLTVQSPTSITRVNDKVTLIDFGKVAFGNIVMPVPQGRGTARVHFGEKLTEGRIDREPPGTVRYGMTTIRRGQQRGNWIVPTPIDMRNVEQAGFVYANPPAVLTPPSWRSVMPFRWIEIEGLEEDFPYVLIQRRAAFSATWNDDASHFESSDETLNRIWDLCKYSIKATTFAGVYVDGDRERIPYEADAYLNQLSHYATDDDVTMAARTFDWLMENGTWPTEWAPHMVMMAHAEWTHHGDANWLRHRYEDLKTKTLLHRSGADGLIRSSEQDQKKHDIVDWPQKERDGYVFTEINTVGNAFHIRAMELMAQMATAVGKPHEAEAFASRAKLARSAFQEALFDEESGLYRDGVETNHHSMQANFFPLAFDLVPPKKQSGVLEWLHQKNMRCSVYAAQYFLEALLIHGCDQKAMELILADGDRSWKHMVNSGTTISWEAWDLKYKPNQDWNHAWGAAPANLLPRFVLGAQPSSPGWEVATIRPSTCGLSFARGKVPTPYGPVQIDWSNDTDFSLMLSLPDGMKAKLNLPARSGTSRVYVDGDAVEAKLENDRWQVESTVSGSVKIVVK